MTNDSFLRYAKEKGEKMITSLNINQSVTQNTIDYISKQLKTENDIVLLHEVTRVILKKSLKILNILKQTIQIPLTSKQSLL